MPLVISDHVIDSTFETNHLMYLNKLHVNPKLIKQIHFSDSLIQRYDLFSVVRESFLSADDSIKYNSMPGSFKILLIKEEIVVDSLQTSGLNQTCEILQSIMQKLQAVASNEDIETLKTSFDWLINWFDGPIYYELSTKGE